MTVKLHTTPVAGTLGAEIQGLDLSQDLEKATSDAIEAALYQYKVIFLRGQQLSPEQQIAFSARIGSIFTDHPSYLPTLDEHPEIVELDGQDGGRANIWHSDVSISSRPPMGSVLYMKTCPEYGGDTIFADMTAAYDSLSDRMKAYLDGPTAYHDLAGTVQHMVRERSEATKSPAGKTPDLSNLPSASHPIVRRHPITGRKILYVNPTFTSHIEGLPSAEGDAVLAYLYLHQNQPEFQCRWRWQEVDVAIWDNRATQHYAIADYGDARRVIHRVTLEGEMPAS